MENGHLKGLCQLETIRAEVIRIIFNYQNSIVFLSVSLSRPRLRHLQHGDVSSELGLDKGYFDRIYGVFLLWLCYVKFRQFLRQE